jgi:hypothetical protein
MKPAGATGALKHEQEDHPMSVTDAAAVAVLERVPVALGSMLDVTVYVTELPAGMLSVSARVGPEEDELPVAPPAATLVQLAVRSRGNVSATETAGSSLGPALATTMV